MPEGLCCGCPKDFVRWCPKDFVRWRPKDFGRWCPKACVLGCPKDLVRWCPRDFVPEGLCAVAPEGLCFGLPEGLCSVVPEGLCSVVPEGLCAGWLVYDFLINIGQDTSINGQFWRPSAIFRGEVVSPKAMARDLPAFCLAIGGIWGEGFGGVWALPSLSPPHFPRAIFLHILCSRNTSRACAP